MKRGNQYDISDTTIAYIHGRIEREIEQISLATGYPFSVIASRIGELLHPLGSQRTASEVPFLRSITTGIGAAVAEVEMVEHSHHHASPPASTTEVQNHRRKALTPEEAHERKKARQREWYALNREKRRKEQRERYRRKKNKSAAVVKAKEAKERKLGKNGRPLITAEERDAKQRIYIARHEAKKKGLPLPPLPVAS